MVGAALLYSSLRGAKRRSNPDGYTKYNGIATP